MANNEFIKQFDTLKQQSKERLDNMTDEQKERLKSKSKRFAQKSKFG